MEELTARQRKALDVIRKHTEKHGIAPSLRELCDYMGYAAIGSAQDMVASLRRKGFLKSAPKQRARSLILKDTPSSRSHAIAYEPVDHAWTIPILGSVPAGVPVEAIEDVVGTLKISPELIPSPKPLPHQLFALQAEGESMVEAGILDGDWLIVKKQEEAPKGSIVIAMLGDEATVKRLERDSKKGWYLKPENPRFKPIFAAEEPFEVIGRVIALQRVF